VPVLALEPLPSRSLALKLWCQSDLVIPSEARNLSLFLSFFRACDFASHPPLSLQLENSPFLNRIKFSASQTSNSFKVSGLIAAVREEL
jgi:hypothetical protein